MTTLTELDTDILTLIKRRRSVGTSAYRAHDFTGCTLPEAKESLARLVEAGLVVATDRTAVRFVSIDFCGREAKPTNAAKPRAHVAAAMKTGYAPSEAMLKVLETAAEDRRRYPSKGA